MTTAGSVSTSPLSCELNTAITCREDIAPPPILPRRHTHPPPGNTVKLGNQRDGRHRRRHRTTSTRSDTVATTVQPTKFQTPLVGGAKGSRWATWAFTRVRIVRVLEFCIASLHISTSLTSALPTGVEIHSWLLLEHHRGRRTNIATSMASTAVTMATMASTGTGGRAGLGRKRTLVSVSWKLIGSGIRRCWMSAVAPVTWH